MHEAVINANNDAEIYTDCVAGSGADTIVFADSLGAATVTYLEGGENRTVGVFVTFNGCVSFDPAVNRIFIEFRDASNNVVGSTSTAASTNR